MITFTLIIFNEAFMFNIPPVSWSINTRRRSAYFLASLYNFMLKPHKLRPVS